MQFVILNIFGASLRAFKTLFWPKYVVLGLKTISAT